MQMLQVVKQAGPDRVIHLSIPVDEAEQNYRLTVTIEPEKAPAEIATADAWPQEFLDRVVGAWEGEFEVGYEGDFEKREEP
ncbi:MAG TPA: hypothetical protein VFI31_02880 [Pirellulales bacterium]|nr:hypothetical protein [Pirellulales bacterium]